MENRSCINCIHVRVCSLQSSILEVLNEHSIIIKDLYGPSGLRIAAALANECEQFLPNSTNKTNESIS